MKTAPGVTDATQSIDPYESLKLTHLPEDVNDIRVFINGTLNHDWYYSLTDNTVYFTVIPNAGDLVEIDIYTYQNQKTRVILASKNVIYFFNRIIVV